MAHGFDRFWVIFTAFKLFSIIFADAKNMHHALDSAHVTYPYLIYGIVAWGNTYTPQLLNLF
jgi:hypothetical protein